MDVASMNDTAVETHITDTTRRVWNWPATALVAIAVAYFATLLAFFSPAITEPDDNGYFAQGSLLFTTGHTWFRAASDAQYIGMHWLVTPTGEYVSRYPPGLAVVIGALYAVFGYRAAVLTNPILSTLMLVGVYFFGRRLGLSKWWAIAGTIVVATNPIVLHHALSGDSHTAVACVLAWGLYFLLRWAQESRPILLFAAGVVLGCIPTIRYPDAVMAIGLGIFVVWQVRTMRRSWIHLLAGAAGAAVPMLPLLIRNQLLFGGFWKTGYALTNESTGFGWDHFLRHALPYIQHLNTGGVGLFFALGLAGIAYLACAKPSRSVGIMLALIVLPMVLLYMAYYWPEGNMMQANATMRFLLPIFPIFFIAGLWTLMHLTRHASTTVKIAVPLVLTITQLLWAVPEATSRVQRISAAKSALASVTRELDQVASEGDVVVASRTMLDQLDFVRHWKVADGSLAGTVRGGMGGGGGGPGMGPPGMGPPDGMGPNAIGGDQPSPMQAEKRTLRQALYPGTTRQKQQKFLQDIEQWADGQSIWLVGTEAEVKQMLGDAVGSRLTIVKQLDIQPPQGGPGGMGGFAGGMRAPGQQGARRGGMENRQPTPSAERYVIARLNAINPP